MAINNMTSLRNDLVCVYEGLRNGAIETKEAREAANVAGKIINSVRAQLEYADLRDEKPSIPFLK